MPVLHGQSSFLSGHSNRSDFDKECYTRANVALSRATDLTVLACSLNMHGLEGAAQVIAALLHGACTLRTSDTVPGAAQIAGSLEIGDLDVQAETAAFLKATEPHPLWEGPAPLCLAEHYEGKVRRLRLVLTKQGCLSQGEQNQFLNHTHPLHGSGLLFGYAADGLANPDWLIVSDTSHPGAWRLLHTVSKAGGSRFTVSSTVRYSPGICDVANKARLYQFEALHKIYFYDAWERAPPCCCPRHQGCSRKDATGVLQPLLWRIRSPLAAWPLMTLTFSVPVVSQVFFHRLTARTAYKTFMTNQPRAAAKKKKKAPPPRHLSPQHRRLVRSPPQSVRMRHRCTKSAAVTHPSPLMRVPRIGKKKLQLMTQSSNNKRRASVWEVNDSSSVSSQGHYEPVDGVRSQSAKSLPSVASPCSQANEQLDAPPAVATGAASAMTEPADITACPSGLPRHRDTIQDNNNMAEGDCPSTCPVLQLSKQKQVHQAHKRSKA